MDSGAGRPSPTPPNTSSQLTAEDDQRDDHEDAAAARPAGPDFGIFTPVALSVTSFRCRHATEAMLAP